jgi:hypothetical protein
MDIMVPPIPVVTEVSPTCEVGTPMRRSYVVPMRWMVIYEYEVPGEALNLRFTKLHRLWSPWESSPSRKNHHSRTGNRTRDFIISSQKLRPLDHEAGQNTAKYYHISATWKKRRINHKKAELDSVLDKKQFKIA